MLYLLNVLIEAIRIGERKQTYNQAQFEFSDRIWVWKKSEEKVSIVFVLLFFIFCIFLKEHILPKSEMRSIKHKTH